MYQDGEPSGDSYSFTSSDYWDMVETGNGIGEYSFKGASSGFNIVSIAITLAKIIAVILVALMALGYLRQKGIV